MNGDAPGDNKSSTGKVFKLLYLRINRESQGRNGNNWHGTRNYRDGAVAPPGPIVPGRATAPPVEARECKPGSYGT
ncbi:hypothetical protein DPMN_030291 [Dreissena polymorpha]|uniref:Uncharacterized protein n=1 Tax=Dreissena polymorpha TaxID=45954 RepID=A0A9D4RG12_DREPO|nr:hypothetical protein DPMN_030291 [Dreissena polymorpha]